jgi:Delta7-sterol 5-desaturase
MWQLYGGGFWVAFAQAVAAYYGSALVLQFLVPAFFPVRSVQKGKPRPRQALREALNSLPPVAIKAAVWTAVERLHASGHSLLYSGAPTSWAATTYMLFTVLALDVLHDAWFYWTHRLLHSKALYSSVHLLHHRSTVPTPFTGYSFHAVEAAIVFANEVLVCFLMPVHVGLHRIYHICTTAIHNGELVWGFL